MTDLSPARRLARDSAMYASAGVVGKLLTLLTVPFLTRLLGAEEYGLADLSTSLAALLTLVARFGGEIPVARLHGTAESAQARARILGTFVLVTAAASIAVACLALPFTGTIAALWATPSETDLATWALMLVPVSAVQVALVTVVRLKARPVHVAILATVDLVAQMLLAVLFAALGGGAQGVVAGYILGSVIGLAVAAVAARRNLDLRLDWRVGRQLLVTGAGYLPVFVAFLLADQVARLVTANALGPEGVGQLAVAIRLASVMTLATSAFSLAWGPLALAMPRSTQTAGTFGTVLRRFLAAGALLALAIGAAAPELTLVVAGSAFVEGASAAPGLLWAGALSGAFYILATASGITGRGGAVALASGLGAAIQIGLSIILVERFGLGGIATAAVIARLISLGALASANRDFVPIRDAAAIGTALVGSGLILGLQHPAVIEMVPLRAVVATVALLLLVGALSPRRASRAGGFLRPRSGGG